MGLIFRFIRIFYTFCLIKFVVSELKNEFISDCTYYDAGTVCCNDIMTLICSNEYRTTDYFQPTDSKCSNSSRAQKSYVGTIYFRNCQFSHLYFNIGETFKNLKKLDISGTKVESLPMVYYSGERKLRSLVASNNRLKEIDGHFIAYFPNLIEVDFAWNKISYINDQTFAGNSFIQHLNFSHNRISSLDPQLMCNLIDLQELDFSFNKLGRLHNNTFMKIKHLEYLDLSHNNLSNIEIGTFTNQITLRVLDLSFNFFKKIDFTMLWPQPNNIEAFHINGNQIKDLEGISQTNFPHLTSLEIKGNNFNCSYLKNFFRSFDVSYLHYLNSNSINGMTHERKIECLEQREEINNEPQHQDHIGVFYKVANILNFWYMSIVLVLVVVVIITFFRVQKVYKTYNASFTSAREDATIYPNVVEY